MDDRELLREYAERRSETAFAELVRRHLDWVHAAALRQTGDAALAQDVAQSVFVLLSRKARAVAAGSKVGGWLFQTTRFVAARARRSEVRRLHREQAVSAMNVLLHDDAEADWNRLEPRLDEAVAALPEADRQAVLLRFYERKPLREVGERLGTTEEGARKRVGRAVEKLRDYLTHRGVTLSAGALAGVLAERVVFGAPIVLEASITQAVLGVSTGAAALPTLAGDTLSAWRWAKLKLAAVLVLPPLLLLLLLQRAETSRYGAGAGRGTTTMPSSAKNAVGPLANATTTTNATRAPQPSGPVLLIAAFDQATGRGLAGARVYFNRVVYDEWQQHQGFATDERGLCSIPLPAEGLGRLDVGVVQDGFVARYATWFPSREDPIPANYAFRLSPAETLGGVVVDGANEPVANASIHFNFANSGDSAHHETPRERVGCLEWFPMTRTDAAGRWSCAISAPGSKDFYLEVKHDRFPSTSFHIGGSGVDRGELNRQQAVLRIQPGQDLAGTVVDLQDRPIAGAKVWAGYSQRPEVRAISDAEGRFVLRRLKSSDCITVLADGFAPQQSDLETNRQLAPVVFRLAVSPVLRVRVVDETGEPVPRAIIAMEGWAEGRRNTLDYRETTDADGRLEWRSAPTGALSICALKKGYRLTRDLQLAADGSEHHITLHRALVVTGRVTDAETGQPISSFKAIPGYGPTRPTWFRSSRRLGRYGDYSLAFGESQYGGPIVQIVADGYELAQAVPQLLSATEGVCDFELVRFDPARGIRGTVLLPDGRPAAGVEVALCTAGVGVTLQGKSFRGNLRTSSGDKSGDYLATTGAEGEFHFKNWPTAHTIVAVGPAGLGKTRLRGTNSTGVVVSLLAWGQITGAVRIHGQPVAGRKVAWYPPGTYTDWGTLEYNAGAISTVTDADGRFTLVDVPPGDAYVAVHEAAAKSTTHKRHVVVPPGGSVEVILGGTGLMITGRLTGPDWLGLDWVAQVQSVGLNTIWKGFQNFPRHLPTDKLEEWKLDIWDSPEAVVLRRAERAYAVAIAADGSFSVPDVEPGDYDLCVTINGERPGTRSTSRLERGASTSTTTPLYGRVKIPDRTPDAVGPLSLGEVPVR